MIEVKSNYTSEAGHWYSRDGEPRYTIIGKNGKVRNTTLRDARTENLVPSVTTILNVAAKPALTAWMQSQVLMATMTLPRRENETEAAYIERIIIDSKQQGRDAADLGTDIHSAIEGFYEGKKSSRFPFHVESCDKALIAHFGAQKWICERAFSHELGFGGKCDMHVPEGIVVDIKTKDFDDKTKIVGYDEHMMQLAAYRVGLGIPTARCANVFVSRTNPELAVVMEWEEDDLKRGWDMFCSLLRFWQYKNQYE